MTFKVVAPWIGVYDDPTFDGRTIIDAIKEDVPGVRTDLDYRRCLRYEVPDSRLPQIVSQIKKVLTAYRSAFDRLGNLNFATHVEQPGIFKYEVASEDKFHPHADNWGYSTSLRQVSALLYLNTVDRGGETRLLNPDLDISPVEGRTLMFPPFYMFPHEGLPPLSGPKYVVVIWITFPKLEESHCGPLHALSSFT